MRFRSCAVVLVAALAACGDNTEPTQPATREAPQLATASKGGHPLLVAANRKLDRRKATFRILKAEYYTMNGSGRLGQEIFAFDRGNKHTGTSYVPGLERPSGATDQIRYLVDQSDGATTTAPTLTNAQTEPAIDRAMQTWEDVRCSKLSFEKVADDGSDPDLVDGLLGFGAVGTPRADVTHAGWYPAAFFDALAPNGSEVIVAITFTFAFTDENGIFTDLDNDGEDDFAFAEVYWNDAFPYGIDTGFPIDVETVALHETGHGLGQAHFGKIFQTLKNGKFHFSPLAAMNAAYTGITQSLLGSDRAGHCSLWGSWPHR